MKRDGAYARGIAKREEILSTALDVIANHGYHGTTLREIAAATNLTPAGLLYYFESKEDLFIEILRKRDEVSVATASDPATPRIVQIARHNMNTPGLVALYSSLSHAATHPDHPGYAFFQERYTRIRDNIAVEIEQLQANGEVDLAVDAKQFAIIALATAEGLDKAWLLDPALDMAAHLEFLWALVRTRQSAG